MLTSSGRPGRHDRISVVRDIVEIVAIVAAGIWAFYVFAYENSFKPAHATPSIDVTASADRLATHDGLIAVHVRTALRNNGTVPTRILGFALTATAQKISRLETARPAFVSGITVQQQAFYKRSPQTLIYSTAHLAKAVDPTSTFDSDFGPGEGSSYEDVIYVPKNRFDLLSIDVNLIYSRDDIAGLAVKLIDSPQTGPDFVFDRKDPRINQFEVDPIDSLDLD